MQMSMKIKCMQKKKCGILCPSPKKGGNFDKEISLLMTSVSPLLNPFIYTLRNLKVK